MNYLHKNIPGTGWHGAAWFGTVGQVRDRSGRLSTKQALSGRQEYGGSGKDKKFSRKSRLEKYKIFKMNVLHKIFAEINRNNAQRRAMEFNGRKWTEMTRNRDKWFDSYFGRYR